MHAIARGMFALSDVIAKLRYPYAEVLAEMKDDEDPHKLYSCLPHRQPSTILMGQSIISPQGNAHT